MATATLTGPMIGTNVLVRYVMQDDPKQSQKASKLIESLTSEAPGFVPLVALIELVWVLTSATTSLASRSRRLSTGSCEQRKSSSSVLHRSEDAARGDRAGARALLERQKIANS